MNDGVPSDRFDAAIRDDEDGRDGGIVCAVSKRLIMKQRKRYSRFFFRLFTWNVSK